jgi:hypothetical protein
MEPLIPRIEAMLQGIVEEKIRDATRDLRSALETTEASWKIARNDLRKALEREATLRAELEALRPNPATPIEVDGFRVGDLVDGFHGPAPIEGFSFGKAQVQGSLFTPRYAARPPVKVGDFVRHAKVSGIVAKVVRPACTVSTPSFFVETVEGTEHMWFAENCLPIAPLNP